MKLRIRISIEIPEGEIQPTETPHALKKEYAPAIQRAVASAFPDYIHPHTVTVTKMNIAVDPVPADGAESEE